ncbi:hypothetical protein CPB83DRAFT_841883 [Crepidotus variabilis]|uniref:Uncharacterized protein n=1 Tax=Crepidotus variabilis TaxID=179855 RepID=A0A9P6EST6_9AGAR|nr:hypothetical protein CPB83DRAFT_841883 [Crepidotus variabilis]
MNSLSHQHSPYESSPPVLPRGYDDIKRLMSTAHSVLEQVPPPSLREILSAYRNKGDGDRDMLLAMLNAKTAEDQRLAAISSLHRTMLDIYQQAPPSPEPNPCSRPIANGAYSYPTPSAYAQSPHLEQHPITHRVHHRHRASSRSRSPHRILSRVPARDAPARQVVEPPRKRHRSSRSPHSHHAAAYEPPHPTDQLPPSPYTSSERSDSAEYSPRSRSSMTIGNLLSTGTKREASNSDNPHDRD